MKRFQLTLLCIVIGLAVALCGCGAAGDPILDNLYTQNVYPGNASSYDIGSETYPYSAGWFDEVNTDNVTSIDINITGSLEREAGDGYGGYWHEYNLDAINLSPGGSGATQIAPNASSVGGYQLNGITEYVFFTTSKKRLQPLK